MISLKELYRVGLFDGCRFRTWYLAKSFTAAVAAPSNQMLEVQQSLSSSASFAGDMRWKLGPCHNLKVWLLTSEPYHRSESHSAVVLLDRYPPSTSYAKGIQRILEPMGPATSPFPDSASNVVMFPKINESGSQPSTSKHSSDGRDSPKHQDDGRGFRSSNLENEGRVLINFSGPNVLSEQKVLDSSNRVKCAAADNLTDSASLTKQPRKKTMKRTRKLLGSQGKTCSSSSTSKPVREGFGEVRRQSSRAMNVYTLNKRINILMEAGYRNEAYAIYEQILPAGCKSDSFTYLHLIKGFCEAGELVEARELFEEICSKDSVSCSCSEAILYNVMIHGLGSAGFVNEALNLVKKMTARGCLPDMYTYNSIIHSLGKVGKVNDALTVFDSMAGKGCTPDVVTYNSLMFSLGKAGRVMEAYKLYERMIEGGCLPDLFTFNTLLPILGKSGEVALAVNLYDFMKLVGCQPDVYTYTSLVATLCRAGRVDEALLVSVEMTERGCAPNTVTFNSWLDGLCKGGRVVEAHLIFKKMMLLGYVPDNITYCILIDAFCKTGQYVDTSFGLLKDLLKSSDGFDSRTSEIVFQSFKKVGMLKQAKRIARNVRAKQSPLGPALKR